MPLNRSTTRHFYRTLYATEMETVKLYKRDDELRQGVVTVYMVFNARRSRIFKTGEVIQGDESSDHTCLWHIPRAELDRIGVHYLSAADRIVQTQGREAGAVWQPEANTMIEVKLFGNMVNLACKRTDFPKPTVQ